jgi:5,10-methylenetetrahydromethanopterin reductase
VNTMVGNGPDVGRQLERLADTGFHEIIYTPSGPDVARELRAFASVRG